MLKFHNNNRVDKFFERRPLMLAETYTALVKLPSVTFYSAGRPEIPSLSLWWLSQLC